MQRLWVPMGSLLDRSPVSERLLRQRNPIVASLGVLREDLYRTRQHRLPAPHAARVPARLRLEPRPGPWAHAEPLPATPGWHTARLDHRDRPEPHAWRHRVDKWSDHPSPRRPTAHHLPLDADLAFLDGQCLKYNGEDEFPREDIPLGQVRLIAVVEPLRCTTMG